MADNLETIEKLIKFMEENGLTELQVKQGDLEFKARRGERAQAGPFVFQPAQGIVHAAPDPSGASPTASGISPAVKPTPLSAEEKKRSGTEKVLKEICSPIVGTFYRRPNPNAPPYKELEDRVAKDDVVCIVEAMKVMNEIKADLGGVIKKILVEDASPVEFGQPLFLVEPL